MGLGVTTCAWLVGLACYQLDFPSFWFQFTRGPATRTGSKVRKVSADGPAEPVPDR